MAPNVLLLTRIVVLIFLLLLVCSSAHGAIHAINSEHRTVREHLQQWICASRKTCVEDLEKERLSSLLWKLTARLEVTNAQDNSTGNISENDTVSGGSSRYPYFSFFPAFMGGAIPDGASIVFSTKCFSRVTVSARTMSPSKLQVTVDSKGLKRAFCADLYLVEGGGGYALKHVFLPLTQRFDMSVPLVARSRAETWYLQTKGVRFLLFPETPLENLRGLVQTLKLLGGFFLSTVPRDSLAASVAFMEDYVQASPRMSPPVRPRTGGSAVAHALDEALISSGDVLLLLRADGLDPMIAWAEGSTVGHTAMALRDPTTGRLDVCESTTASAYWPINGVQCNAWVTWLQMVERAGQNVLWLPLAPKYRVKFNSTAAQRFLHEHTGVDYGYTTFLFGWLDTLRDNLPCVPPDFNTTCLSPDTLETLLVLIDRVLGTNRQNIVRQAFAHRVGRWPEPLSVVDSLFETVQSGKNMSFSDIYQMPERDEWLYNTTRGSGPTQTENVVEVASKSMVCCVLLCNAWKAGGLFADAIDNKLECAEQTLWDIYSMRLFDSNLTYDGRPDLCKRFDPQNSLCQLTGDLSLELQPDVNTRELYQHMGERCSSKAPNYIRSTNC